MVPIHVVRAIVVVMLCLIFSPNQARPQSPGTAPPNAIDRLKSEDIPAAERFPWQPKEVVAVYGSHAWRYWRPGHLSTDGTKVTVSAENTVYDPRALSGWDAATGKQLRLLKVPPYTAMGFSARGTLAAFSRENPADWSLTVVEFPTGKLKHKLTAKGNAPQFLIFSPTGKWLAFDRGHLEVMDPATGKQLLSANYRGSPVFHPAGKLIFSMRNGFKDEDENVYPGRVFLDDLATRKERVLYETPGPGTDLFLTASADGRWLAIGNRLGGKVQLWDVSKGKAGPVFSLKEGIHSFAFSPDSKTLACGQYDRCVGMYDPATGKERSTLGVPMPGQPIDQPVFSPDGKRLAAFAIADFGVLHWDIATGEALHAPAPVARLLAVAADGNTLLVGTEFDQRFRAGQLRGLQVHDIATGKHRDLVLAKDEAAVSAAFTPDGRSIALLVQVPGSTQLRVYDTSTLKGASHLIANGEAAEIHISPDGKTLAAGALFGGRIELHGTAAWQYRTTVPGTPDRATSMSGLAFGGDSKTLVASTSVGLKLIDVAEGKVRSTVATERQGVVAVSPDGTKVAVTNYGAGIIAIFDMVNGKELYELKGHAGVVSGVCFDRDGESCFSAGHDGKIIRWSNFRTKTEWRFPGPVTSLRLSPEGRHLLANIGHGTLYVLRVAGTSD